MHWISMAVAATTMTLLSLTASVQGDWGEDCPVACSCHLSELRDLPMHRWFLEGVTNSNESLPVKTYHHTNKVLYWEDETSNMNRYDTNGLLKTAICIFQRDVVLDQLLRAIPKDVQVMTLMQSPGTGQLTLSAQHFSSFSDLVAFEIHGMQDEDSSHTKTVSHDDIQKSETPQDELVLMSNTFRHLIALKFLNIQYVRFLGQPDDSAARDASYQYLANKPSSKEEFLKKRPPIAHELVFLPSEADPVPYKEFKEAQERASLSIFAGLNNLVFLRVYNCELKEVNWEMFNGLNKLEYLSLEKNHLLFITDYAFFGTPNLKILSLASNKILSLQYTGLAGLLELEKLDLSHNNVSHLTELSLPPFPKLIQADFRHNPIEQIFPGSFEIMNATDTLYLGGEGMSLRLQHRSLQGLRLLRRLFIFNLKIDSLEQEMLQGMPKLKEIQLQGQIKALAYDAFASVPKVEILTLNHCGIQAISMDAFYGLYGLLALDLSHNLLPSLPPGIFDQLQSLKELHLQNNKLTELPEMIFFNLQAKMIRLDENPWDCSCAMKEWRPMSINKVKVRTEAELSSRDNSYDKGASIPLQQTTQYIYDKRVAPKCKKPLKYLNWSVFHVLRKELRCGKSKNKKTIIWRKHAEHRNSTKAYKENNNTSVHMENVTDTPTTVTTVPADLPSSIPPSSLAAVSTRFPALSVENIENKEMGKDVIEDNNLKVLIVDPTANQETAIPDEDPNDLNNMLSEIGFPVVPNRFNNRDFETMTKPLQISSQERATVENFPSKKSLNPTNDFMISHGDKQLKVSKKAWKLEMERLKDEKEKKIMH